MLVLGDFAQPPGMINSGSQVRTHAMADELANAGFTVDRVPRDLVPRSREALGTIAGLPRALSKADAVCVVGIPHRNLPYRLLTLLSRTTVPVALDFNDDPILQYECLMNRSHPKAAMYRRLIRLFVERSSLIAFLTDSMRAFYLETWSREGFPPGGETSLLPNATDPNHFQPAPLASEPRIGYLGGIAPGRGLELLVSAVGLLQSTYNGVKLIIGTNDLNQVEASLAAKIQREKFVTLVRGVDYRAAPGFLKSLRICVIPHLRSPYMDFIVPIKLFDYMAASRPVLATDCSEQARVLQETGAGLTCVTDSGAVAASLERLLASPELCSTLARAGRRSTEECNNWAARVGVFGDRLASLA